MGPLHLQQRLQLLSSRRPIVSQRIAADAPTAFSAAVAASFEWAFYFSEKYCRYPQMGPLHLQQQLPLASHGPIISLINASVQKRGRESERERQSKVKAQLCSHEEEVDDEEKTEKRTLMIPGTTEGHIYAQDPLCYTSGTVLISLRCVEKGTQ